MSDWEKSLAFIHAPIVLQKTDPQYLRSDCIVKANFAGKWENICSNWDAVWEKDANGRYKHKLSAHGYYSVVETYTHYFIVYAFYHPQDWTSFWGSPKASSPSKLDQHIHDMEGALAVVPKRKEHKEQRVEALITISHVHFYSFAGWVESNGKEVPIPGKYLIKKWTENLDGSIQVTKRFREEAGEPDFRFKLYIASGSHAIKGTKKDWGVENFIVRYRPSLEHAGEPGNEWVFEENNANFQDVPYRLISIHEQNGLWAQLEIPEVFKHNEKGQMAFSIKRRKEFESGSANPPWGWDDKDDRHKPGEFAWDPAHLVNDYFNGLREFSREYIHNRYIGFIKP
jgi:hypothetical protein